MAGADKFKDFVNDLNLTTGLALGHGGVFVLQSPYLLFYSDRNGDDIPDGDPEVCLTGFGMEDSHAFANSLTWAGWLAIRRAGEHRDGQHSRHHLSTGNLAVPSAHQGIRIVP